MIHDTYDTYLNTFKNNQHYSRKHGIQNNQQLRKYDSLISFNISYNSRSPVLGSVSLHYESNCTWFGDLDDFF